MRPRRAFSTASARARFLSEQRWEFHRRAAKLLIQHDEAESELSSLPQHSKLCSPRQSLTRFGRSGEYSLRVLSQTLSSSFLIQRPWVRTKLMAALDRQTDTFEALGYSDSSCEPVIDTKANDDLLWLTCPSFQAPLPV